MAMHAELALSFLAGCIVAFIALLFELFMGLDHRPGHQ